MAGDRRGLFWPFFLTLSLASTPIKPNRAMGPQRMAPKRADKFLGIFPGELVGSGSRKGSESRGVPVRCRQSGNYTVDVDGWLARQERKAERRKENSEKRYHRSKLQRERRKARFIDEKGLAEWRRRVYLKVKRKENAKIRLAHAIQHVSSPSEAPRHVSNATENPRQVSSPSEAPRHVPSTAENHRHVSSPPGSPSESSPDNPLIIIDLEFDERENTPGERLSLVQQ
ncbi:hypothetical protein AAMO2058_001682700 [Amorphochlora amoebiformis]